ncbi:MAG TPA: GntR family transcriptional regulator [Propionibacteriaceae bacterium]|nr:GntR family transcriptional regulator [Propionibacteriaceae bacterium]
MAASEIKSIEAIGLQTRRELILDRLRQAISSGQLSPGTHLAEVELSAALGVSRGTLREALRHLQQEGLLMSDTRGRLSVRVVDTREVEEIFAVRHALESLALQQICKSEDRSRMASDLRQQLDRLRAAEGEFTAQLDADLAFHARLCELSGNRTLLHTWRGVSGLARAAITAAGAATALHNMAYERHLPIVELIEAGDVAGGVASLERHMDEAAQRIIGQMRITAEAAS